MPTDHPAPVPAEPAIASPRKTGPVPADRAAQDISVFEASALQVIDGANLGDPLGPHDACEPGDLYRFAPDARLRSLRLRVRATPPYEIAADSRLGRPGATVHLDCCVTLMSGRGETVEILILVETDPAGMIAATHAMPLAPIRPRTDYALVGLDRDGALARFAQAACMSFAAGTAITLASGEQRPVEDLRPGDRILTRDDGPRPLRWIGRQTLRATGTLAPVLIRAGTLNNARDLLLSPDHRLFIYQRRDALGAGRAEVLIRARDLVNGDTILRAEGGHVDYFQMLFDAHQIVYAEGIAAESMRVDARTRAALPDAIDHDIPRLIPLHARSPVDGLELREARLADPRTAEALRRASAG